MTLTKEEKERRREERQKKKYDDTHKLIDGIIYKICSECSEWKPCDTDHYYANKSNGMDGLHPYCKECTKKRTLNWQYANYEYWKTIVAKRDATPVKKAKTREAAKRQRESGYYKKYQEENKEKFRQYQFNHLHKKHDITDAEWDECKSYFDNSCAYCGISEVEAKKEYGQYLHMEHAINSGLNDITNCVPACRSCNSKKWIRDYDEWYTEEEPMYSKERLNKVIKWLSEDCYK